VDWLQGLLMGLMSALKVLLVFEQAAASR